jgi:pimeloyl-ACP methyl ester carboxylesterase
VSVAHQPGRCKSGDIELSYRRVNRGQGRISLARKNPALTPILFVHGLSYFSWDWLEAAAALQGDCVCMDMRGFGDSAWAKDYSVPTMASDLGALMDHLGWEKAAVVGHSMGGRNSAYFAAKNPQRVSGLVLVDYSPENAPAGSKRVATSVAGVPDVFATVDEAMAYFKAGAEKRARYEAYLKPVPGGYAIKRDTHFRDQFRKALATGERAKPGVDMWQVLGELRVPTLVLRGTRSDIFAPETAAKVKAANPRIQLALVEGGHNLAVDNLHGFLAAVRPFIASLQESNHAHARH